MRRVGVAIVFRVVLAVTSGDVKVWLESYSSIRKLSI